MARGIILYRSKYGATQRYAGWLAEETGFDCVELKGAKPELLDAYDTVVLGGGIYASGIAGLSFLKKNAGRLRGKRAAVFCVGASPYDEEPFQALYRHNFTGGLDGIPCFYCRGAWEESKMNPVDRTLCRMMQKMVAKKDPNECEPWEKALLSAGGGSCDWTDRESLRPLLDFLNGTSQA